MSAFFGSMAGLHSATISNKGAGTWHRTGFLVAVLMLGAVISACGDDDEALTTVTTPPTTTTSPTTTSPTTTVASDGLDCPNESRMMTVMEPPEGFAGYATPEDAARSAAEASMIPLAGTPETLGGADWIIRTTDGRAVARTRVEPWGQGWFAGEITACDDGQHGS